MPTLSTNPRRRKVDDATPKMLKIPIIRLIVALVIRRRVIVATSRRLASPDLNTPRRQSIVARWKDGESVIDIADSERIPPAGICWILYADWKALHPLRCRLARIMRRRSRTAVAVSPYVAYVVRHERQQEIRQRKAAGKSIKALRIARRMRCHICRQPHLPPTTAQATTGLCLTCGYQVSRYQVSRITANPTP